MNFRTHADNTPVTRAILNLETDLFRASVHIGRNGEGAIESASELATKEGWPVSKARRVLAAGEKCNRFWFDMANHRWAWTPEFANS